MPAVHLFLGLSLVTTVGCGRVGFDDADGDAAAATNAISLGPLSVTNVTLTTFEVEIPFTGDANRDASVTLSRCNDTDAIGCHPSTGQREVMTRGAASFTATITVSAGDDPNDTLTLEASPMDPDGAPASVTGSVTLTAASACMHGTMTFTFTGAATSFVVPSGCTVAVVKAWGAGGGGAGGDTNDPGSTGGGGGFARSTLDIAPGETLTIEVGGGGGGGGVSPALIASGGGGGGDLSGVRRGANFLVIAGGGGGAAGNIGGGAPAPGVGGGAAGTAGGNDSNQSMSKGGGAGTATVVGVGGNAGTGGGAGTSGVGNRGGAGGVGNGGGGGAPGALGYGGAGGGKGTAGNRAGGGGGGGGGFFGGGGGGSGAGTNSGGGAPGGGGSALAIGTASLLITGAGAMPGNALDPMYQAGVGTGGLAGLDATNGGPGGNGLVVISY